MSYNWLRVSDTAERSQVAQRIGHHLHAIVPPLDTCKAEPQAFARIFPRKGPLDPHPPGMEGGVAEPRAPALGALAVAGILWNIGEQARLEDARPIVCRIKTAIQIARGPSEVSPALFGHLLQRLEALRQQAPVRLMDGRPGDRRYDVAMMVDDRNDLVALLMLVPRDANAIAPFLATVLVPSPWSTLRSSCFASARCRTLATHACHSAPSSAHVAKTRYTVV